MPSFDERIAKIKVDRFNIKYSDLQKQIAQIKLDLIELTENFQMEFNVLTEIMGCFVDGLNEIKKELHSQKQC